MDTIITMLESDEELLKLVTDNEIPVNVGLTSKEISQALGWSEKKTLRRLNELIALGKIKCVMAYRKYNTGFYNKKPVYIKMD